MQKIGLYLSVSVSLLLSAASCQTNEVDKEVRLRIETKSTSSGDSYKFFYLDSLKAGYTDVRPSKHDSSIILCIPGAFTRLDNGEIDGTYVSSGKVENRNKVNRSLGGGIILKGNDVSIINTHKGKLINDSLLGILQEDKASFFQQIQMIISGKAEGFKDKSLFQRRAIVIMKSGEVAVVENSKGITLTDFCDQLVKFGVMEALYVDMGSWDEGWYRDNGIKVIGNIRSATDRQSNWVIFKKP